MTKVRQRWEGCGLHEEESERQNDRRTLRFLIGLQK